jgi:hypothetical protein
MYDTTGKTSTFLWPLQSSDRADTRTLHFTLSQAGPRAAH